jgi:hypothetical protein
MASAAAAESRGSSSAVVGWSMVRGGARVEKEEKEAGA